MASTYVEQQKWSCHKTVIYGRFWYNIRCIFEYFGNFVKLFQLKREFQLLSESATRGALWKKALGLQLWQRLWHRCFPVNFEKFLKTPFLQNTSGRLLLWFMAFSDWEFLLQRFKNICYWKIDCGKHYRLSKYFIKFSRTSSGTAKAIASFKETANCKIPQAFSAIWDPGTGFS